MNLLFISVNGHFTYFIAFTLNFKFPFAIILLSLSIKPWTECTSARRLWRWVESVDLWSSVIAFWCFQRSSSSGAAITRSCIGNAGTVTPYNVRWILPAFLTVCRIIHIDRIIWKNLSSCLLCNMWKFTSRASEKERSHKSDLDHCLSSSHPGSQIETFNLKLHGNLPNIPTMKWGSRWCALSIDVFTRNVAAWVAWLLKWCGLLKRLHD